MRFTLLFLLLAGCATGKSIYLPDGRQGHAIDCSGSPMTWRDCYAKAGEICKANGYEIISKEGEERAGAVGTHNGIFAGQSHNRSLVIACK